MNKENAPLTPEQIKSVKGQGFLNQRGTDKFNARVVTRNGRLSAQEIRAVADAAEQYGDGHMMMTTRLSIEVSGVSFENIPAFREAMVAADLSVGGTGPKIRPMVACKGTTCQYGLCDTYAISEELHHRFYEGYRGVTLHHKFKIAVGGCPNNCVKPNLNDIGLMGAKTPCFDTEACKGCKKCKVEEACPVQAAKLTGEKLVIDPEVCLSCGRCAGKCPFHCTDKTISGFKLFLGGRWGKTGAAGRPMGKIFESKEEALDTIEKAILFYKAYGNPGERFASTLERIGFQKAEEIILSQEMLDRKEEILG